MESDEKRKDFTDRLAKAEKILVGIGGEWKSCGTERKAEVKQAAAALKNIIGTKEYFVITTLQGEDLGVLDFEKGHMAAPLDVSFTEEQWDAYLRWLSFTLNRNTVILELGEDFSRPAMIRWPFEKTAALNNRAFLYRINEKFSQIPDELKGKALPVAENSVKFMASFEKNAGESGPGTKHLTK